MIKKNSAMDAWKTVMRYVLHDGSEFTDKDGRKCRELLNLRVEIKSPIEDITAPIERLGSSRIWVYPRLDEIANVALTRKSSPGHVYLYGHRIFNYDEEINQADKFVIPLLRKDATTRRAIISLWNPKEDSDMFNKEVPSLMTLLFTIDGRSINVSAVIRSNNVLFGMPANVYQIYLLQDYVAQRLDMAAGNIAIYLLSAHIFEDQFGSVKEILSE